MASVRRSPLQEVFSFIPGDEQLHSFISVTKPKIEARLEQSSSLFDFYVPQLQVPKLTKVGINLSPYLSGCHSHPFSKMLENNIVFVKAFEIFKLFKRVLLVSTKESKAEHVKNIFISKGLDTVFEVFNRSFSPKDFIRYKHPKDPGKFFEKCLDYEGEGDLIFLYDELHYWSKGEWANFLSNVRCKNILASVVIPPEILSKDKIPLNPKEYDFEIKGDKLLCYPDGVRSEGYCQPVGCSYLLTHGNFICKGGIRNYGSSMIASTYDHHLLFFRENSPGDEFRSFADFDVLDPKTMPFLSRSPIKLNRVRESTMKKMHLYLNSLKTGSISSATARVRQLQDDSDLNVEELIFSQEVFKKVSRNPDLTTSDARIIQGWWFRYRYNCPTWLQRVLFRNTRVFKEDLESLLGAKVFKIDCQMETHDLDMSLRSQLNDRQDEWGKIGTSFDFGMLKEQFEEEPIIWEGFDGRYSLLVGDRFLMRFKKKKSFFESCFMNFGDKLNDEEEPVGDPEFWVFLHHRYPVMRICYDEDEFDDNIEEGYSGNVSAFPRLRVEDFPFINPVDTEIQGHDIPVEKNGTNGSLEANALGPEELEQVGTDNLEIGIDFGEVTGLDLNIGFKDLEPELEFVTTQDVVAEEGEGVNQDLSLEADLRAINFGKSIDEVRDVTQESPKCNLNLTNKCLLVAVAAATGLEIGDLVQSILEKNDRTLIRWLNSPEDAGESMIYLLSICLGLDINLISTECADLTYKGSPEGQMNSVTIFHKPGHFYYDPEADLGKGISCSRKGSNWARLENGSKAAMDEYLKRLSCGEFGVISKKIKQFPFVRKELMVQMSFGVPGSGKSHAIEKLIQKTSRENFPVSVISAKRALCEDWSEKITRKRAGVSTYEKALLRSFSPENVVLDEVFQMPNGFFEALTSKFDFESIYVTGDPLQSTFHSPTCESINLQENYARSAFDNQATRYLMYSYRLPKAVCEMYGINCLSKEEGEIKFIDSSWQEIIEMDKNSRLLTATDGARRDLEELGFISPHSYTSCQGLTIREHYYIMLDESSFKVSQEGLFVASTRGTKGYTILNCTGQSLFRISTRKLNKFFLPMIGQGKINIREEMLLKYPSIKFQENPIRGAAHIIHSEGETVIYDRKPVNPDLDKESRIMMDPWLCGMVDLSNNVNDIEVPIIEPTCKEVDMKVNIPLSTKDNLIGMIDELARGKEEREIRGKDQWSNQFIEEDPLCFKNLYPTHKANDDVTLWAGIKKRLRFGKPVENLAKMRGSTRYGDKLFNNFIKMVPIPRRFDQSILEECQAEFEAKKFMKPSKLVENHSNRSDPDWPTDWVFIFGKVQQCTKLEKFNSDAIASQTIACFHHAVLHKFAWLSRYIEKVVTRSLPKRLYIHQKKNLSELDDWVVNQDFSGICTESDFSAFDASQDSIVLNFEVRLMKHLMIPESVIQDYIIFKTHLGCRFGELAIMRFTGEFCTFMFNTLANMAYTFSRYEDNKFCSIAFAGDDMICNKNLKESKRDEELMRAMSLKAKIKRHDRPTFCGWRLTKFGIIKDPMLLCTRVLIAIENGNIDECIISYSLECLFAFSKKDLLYSIFSIEDMEYHHVALRNLIRSGGRSKYKRYIEQIFKVEDRYPHVNICKGHHLEEELKRKLISMGYTLDDRDE